MGAKQLASYTTELETGVRKKGRIDQGAATESVNFGEKLIAKKKEHLLRVLDEQMKKYRGEILSRCSSAYSPCDE